MSKKPGKEQAIFGSIFAIGATAIWSGNFIVARDLSESIAPKSQGKEPLKNRAIPSPSLHPMGTQGQHLTPTEPEFADDCNVQKQQFFDLLFDCRKVHSGVSCPNTISCQALFLFSALP